MVFFRKKRQINEYIDNLPLEEAVSIANKYIALLNNYLGRVQDENDRRVCVPFDKSLYVESFTLDTFFWSKTVKLTFVELPRFKRFDVREDSIVIRTPYASFLYHYLAILDDLIQENNLGSEIL